MKLTRLSFCVLSVVLLILASCGKQEKEDSFDVRLDIPSVLTVESGVTSIRFSVIDGKAPLATDAIVLSGPVGQKVCTIKNVTSSSVEINLPSAFSAGEYSVSVQRGAKLLKQGVVIIRIDEISDGVQPFDGSTVYGRVSCSGVGVAGVAVSDGVEVIVTDSDGIYQLKSKKYHKYVFISVPSGYVPMSQGILPVIHKQLTLRADAPERVDFELVKMASQDNHTVLIFGDMHLARRNGDRDQFAHFTADVNEYTSSHTGESIFGLTLGDMTWDQYWLVNDYGFKDYLVDAANIRGLQIYHTIGNHDHSMYYAGDYDTVVEYKTLVAPTYYSYNIGKVHYIVIDDIECTNSGEGTAASRSYNTNIVQDQIDWLKKDLALVPKDTPLLITMHAPMYKNPGTSRGGSGYNIKSGTAAQLENAIKGYSQVHIFTAHTHKMYNVDNLATDSVYEHNAGAVCATWWWTGKLTPGVQISQDGTPAGYTVLKVKGTEFSWQFKATGMDIGHQFRTYDRNQIELTADNWISNADAEKTSQLNSYNATWRAASTDNYVYMNIWNYDPSWTIEVRENGTPLTVTRLGTTMDPLHVVSYTVPRIASGGSLSFPTSNTYHMFRVKATAPDTTLEIKVTDRFGNVYTESMTRPKPFTVANYRVPGMM